MCDYAHQQEQCAVGRGGSCYYRDFSGARPSNAELKRYKNNKIFIAEKYVDYVYDSYSGAEEESSCKKEEVSTITKETNGKNDEDDVLVPTSRAEEEEEEPPAVVEPEEEGAPFPNIYGPPDSSPIANKRDNISKQQKQVVVFSKKNSTKLQQDADKTKKNPPRASGNLNEDDVFKGNNFPSHLYDLLSSSDAEGGGGKEGDNNKPPAIAWLVPHGRSWIIRDKKDFMLKKIIPSRHFKVSKMRR
jgi:hypothetical protein